jgi:hypothetical protein
LQCITHHADHGGDVIVQRHEDGLVAVGPGCREILQRHVVEVHVVHRDECGTYRIASGDQVFHLREHRVGRRYAGEPVMNDPGLFAGARMSGQDNRRRHDSDEHDANRCARPSLEDFLSHCRPRPVFHSCTLAIQSDPTNRCLVDAPEPE